METNLESMFEHVNQMANTDMPRDFLASLSKHFFREDGEKFTTFQKLQTEACLLLEQRRPHWRKRKAKSASQFLSMFYLLEKEVMDSKDQVAMNLFVEAFNSREAYVESVMIEFDEIDRLEKQMSSGPAIKVPGFVYDDDAEAEADDETQEDTTTNEFDFSNCIMELSEIIEDLDEMNKSKYVKIFEKDGEMNIGIHNARIKALAKRSNKTLTPFPSVRNYPSHVKSSTKTFTKLTATSSVGSSNTSAGYCMLTNIKHISGEAKSRILDVLGKDDTTDEQDVEEHGDALDEDLLPSQDFPNLFQSQTSDTLLHCTLCEYLSRSKVDFEERVAVHPKCTNCGKQFENGTSLQVHMEATHPSTLVLCNTCGKEFPTEAELRDHMKDLFLSYKKALERNPKTTPKSKSKSASNVVKKKKTMNCYLVFVDEHRAKMKEDNPTLSANQITKLLSEAWNSLSKDEQKVYKVKAAQMNSSEEVLEVPCPKCGEKFNSNGELIKHLMKDHIDVSSSTTLGSASTSSGTDSTQSTIHKCGTCGKMFINKDRLDDHKAENHGVQPEVAAAQQTGVVAADDAPITLEEIEEESVSNLVWVKLANQPWPARVISTSGEISEVELFDEEQTRKMIEHIKLNQFNKLTKIPKRLNIWKATYARALQCMEIK